MPQPMRRPSKPTAPGSLPTVTVTLKSLRNPQIDVSLTSQPLSTNVLDLKQITAEKANAVGGAEKIRLLYNKKPCADTKTLKDVVGEGVVAGQEVDFTVMIIGAAPSAGGAPPEAEKVEDVVMEGVGTEGKGNEEVVPVAQGSSGKEVLDSEKFWDDLKGFLIQRVRDEDVAGAVWGTFRESWKAKTRLGA